MNAQKSMDGILVRAAVLTVDIIDVGELVLKGMAAVALIFCVIAVYELEAELTEIRHHIGMKQPTEKMAQAEKEPRSRTWKAKHVVPEFKDGEQ